MVKSNKFVAISILTFLVFLLVTAGRGAYAQNSAVENTGKQIANPDDRSPGGLENNPSGAETVDTMPNKNAPNPGSTSAGKPSEISDRNLPQPDVETEFPSNKKQVAGQQKTKALPSDERIEDLQTFMFNLQREIFELQKEWKQLKNNPLQEQGDVNINAVVGQLKDIANRTTEIGIRLNELEVSSKNFQRRFLALESKIRGFLREGDGRSQEDRISALEKSLAEYQGTGGIPVNLAARLSVIEGKLNANEPGRTGEANRSGGSANSGTSSRDQTASRDTQPWAIETDDAGMPQRFRLSKVRPWLLKLPQRDQCETAGNWFAEIYPSLDNPAFFLRNGRGRRIARCAPDGNGGWAVNTAPATNDTGFIITKEMDA